MRPCRLCLLSLHHLSPSPISQLYLYILSLYLSLPFIKGPTSFLWGVFQICYDLLEILNVVMSLGLFPKAWECGLGLRELGFSSNLK
jgi:hypothetical protein